MFGFMFKLHGQRGHFPAIQSQGFRRRPFQSPQIQMVGHACHVQWVLCLCCIFLAYTGLVLGVFLGARSLDIPTRRPFVLQAPIKDFNTFYFLWRTSLKTKYLRDGRFLLRDCFYYFRASLVLAAHRVVMVTPFSWWQPPTKHFWHHSPHSSIGGQPFLTIVRGGPITALMQRSSICSCAFYMLECFCSWPLSLLGKYWYVLTYLLFTDFYQFDSVLVVVAAHRVVMVASHPAAGGSPLSLSGTIIHTHLLMMNLINC